MNFDEQVTTNWFTRVSVNSLPYSKAKIAEVNVTIPAKIVVSKLYRYFTNAEVVVFNYEGKRNIMGEDFPFIKKVFSGFDIEEKKSSLILRKNGVKGEEESKVEERIEEPEDADDTEEQEE